MSHPKRWSRWMVWAIIMLIVLIPTYVIPAIFEHDLFRFALAVYMSIFLGVPLLRSFGVRIGESQAPIAGLGVIEDRRGRRWTVKDSTLLVHQHGSDRSKINVDFAGPAGHLRIKYWGTDDAGFRLLWQRWNHPHPRTELG